MDQKIDDNKDNIEKNDENDLNLENLEEKKKSGFFSMLSNLMTSDKKTTEVINKSPEKKQKSKKTKTDPNLFLFSDVLEEDVVESRQNPDVNEISELSDISEFSSENEANEDIDSPSYLRKGSNN